MNTTTRCPVCGTEIRTDDPAESGYRDEEWRSITVGHGGETYRVCSDDCEAAFEESPDEYV